MPTTTTAGPDFRITKPLTLAGELSRFAYRRALVGRSLPGGYRLAAVFCGALLVCAFLITDGEDFFAGGGLLTAFLAEAGFALADGALLGCFPAPAERFRCAAGILSRASTLKVRPFGFAFSSRLREPLVRPGRGFAGVAVAPNKSRMWVNRAISRFSSSTMPSTFIFLHIRRHNAPVNCETQPHSL